MGDPTTDAILDATRTSVLDVGIRRTTLTNVAHRAGVSRMTVYRRYPDVDAVLRDLMTREFGALMADIGAQVDGPHGRARVVNRVTAGVRSLGAEPLMRRVLEAEPELLLPYVLGRMGGTQRLAVALLAHDVAEGQADGSVRAGDPRAIAISMLLVAQSFLLSSGIAEDVADEDLEAELAHLVEAALAP